MAITQSWPTDKGIDSRIIHCLGEEPTLCPVYPSQGLHRSWAGWLKICLMATYGFLIISLPSLLACQVEDTIKRGKGRQLKCWAPAVKEAITQASNLPTSHIQGTPLSLSICPSHHPFPTESLSCHLEKASWEQTFWAAGKHLGRVRLPLLMKIVLAEALTFCSSSWHRLSMHAELNHYGTLTWHTQKRCMSLLIPEPGRKLHLEEPRVSLALEKLLNPVCFVWNFLPKKRPKIN